MARKYPVQLTEENLVLEYIVGQANDGSRAYPGLRPDGSIMTKEIALDPGDLVGCKPDGKVYLASAASGAGQLRATAYVFQEAVNGQAVDMMRKEITWKLPTALSSVNRGDLAYLSPTSPGQATNVKPTTTGQLVQVVGIFEDAQHIKFKIHDQTTVVP